MIDNLTPEETRIIGCLLEKSVTTPDQYPLTLNALTNACNQKSSRNPVMSLEQGTVARTARMLEEQHLVTIQENFKSRVVKYQQRFCNTPFSELQFTDAEYAVICLLLLRGPQTPGELRTRSGRLFQFRDNAEVTETLVGLLEREKGPVVARLPRTPGRQDSEYAHLFSGAIESAPAEAVDTASVRSGDTQSRAGRADRISELELRVAELERELIALKDLLDMQEVS